MSKRKTLRILSLDGGDARCMSQLHILGELMYRLEQKKGIVILPCDYFDLIVGVDGAGLIATLLGLLKMSPEEAQEAFFKIYMTVFEDDSYSPEVRASRLEGSFRELLRSRNHPDTAMISSFADTTKVALCYAPAARMDSCKMFRNYRSSQQSIQNVTLVQAIRATWATPGVIAPIMIGPPGREEKIVSATYGFSNPVQEAIREAFNTFGPEARIALLLSLGSGHRAVISLGEEKHGSHNIGARMMKDGEIVADDVERRLGHLGIYRRLSVDRGLESWNCLADGFGAIKSHADAYLSKTESNNKLEQCLLEGHAMVSLEQIYRPKAPVLRKVHGLPPLSAYFVMRKKPMTTMSRYLIESPNSVQRIMVMSGLGGSGKTQLALRFARDFENSYSYILFVDASSAESIRRGIIARVSAVFPDNPPTTVQAAMDILAYSEDMMKDWFIIFDNADDSDVNYHQFIPDCEHGSILITTRDPSLEALAPNAHLKLDTMDPDEAVDALLSCAFPMQDETSTTAHSLIEESIPKPTARDRSAAAVIAEELGHLPIAIIQAGCYIRQHQALHQYYDRLKSNRSELLQKPTRFHRDKLKYPHGVYASFDITLNALSRRAVQLLGILAFFHFAGIPRLLLVIAIKSNFLYDPHDLLNRPSEFEATAQYLSTILAPNDEWSENDIDCLFEELQKYSLVTPVAAQPTVAFRFHPLVLKWARDRMTPGEHTSYQAAAIRLLVCGITKGDDYYLYDQLSPHVTELAGVFDQLHINDRAAISTIVFHNWNLERFSHIWNRIYQEVVEVHGEQHIRTTRALLELGAVAWWKGDIAKAEEIQRNALAIREGMPDCNRLEVLEARTGLGRIIRVQKRYKEAEEMQGAVIRELIEAVGFMHSEVADAMMDLAETFFDVERSSDEQHFLSAAAFIWTRLLGRSSRRTIRSLQALAQCHEKQSHYEETEELQKEILGLHQAIHGDRNLNTAISMSPLAKMYHLQGRYDQAELLRAAELETRRALQGDSHLDTLATISWLGAALFEQKKDVEKLWTEELEGRREVQGRVHLETLTAMHNLARNRYQQKRWADARMLWMEELEARRQEQGNNDLDTLEAIYWIGKTYYIQNNHYYAEKFWREELEARTAQQKDELTQRVTWYLSLMLNAEERYQEAREIAEITVRIRRNDIGDGLKDARLLASTRLLDSINSKIPVVPVAPKLITGPEITIEELAEDNANNFDETNLAPDPGGEPTSLTPQISLASLPITRPRSPFAMRDLFAGRPNSWSMF